MGGCVLSKPAIQKRINPTDPKNPKVDTISDQDSKNFEHGGRQSRARRLSQTIFEAEDYKIDDPVTISVPVPVLVGGSANVPNRKRRERRASYIQLDLDPTDRILTYAMSCVAGVESGRPKRNQDAVLVHVDSSICVFAVFDGHGRHGHHCSNFIKTCFISILKIQLLNDVPVGQAISQSIKEAETALLDAPFDCSLSGTTAVIAMVQASRLLLGWVGDSSCFVICNKDETPTDTVANTESSNSNFECQDITFSHNFDLPGERERVLARGGRVMRWNDQSDWVGPLRVFLSDTSKPGLNMSRSLGDIIGHKIGVSSEPDIKCIDLNKEHQYIVVCSDGITEFLTSKEIAKIIASSNDVQNACDSVVMLARQRWYEEESQTEELYSIDDCSIIIIQLNHIDQSFVFEPA